MELSACRGEMGGARGHKGQEQIDATFFLLAKPVEHALCPERQDRPDDNRGDGQPLHPRHAAPSIKHKGRGPKLAPAPPVAAC